MTMVESGYAPIEGASLYYELVGTGPTLVLLHGFSFDTTVWDDQIESFSRSYRVLRYDLRGFGRSESSAVHYSHAVDLKALLDHLHIHETSLVGLSMGGGAAINFALSFPGIAKALVLIAPSLSGFRWSSNFSAAQSSIQKKVKEKGIEAAREIWLRQTIFRHAMGNKKVAARLQEMVRRYSGWHWMNADLGMPLNPPAIDRLGEISIPTLVIIGDRDATDQLQIADTIEHAFPDSRTIVFPGVGHLVNMEVPVLFNQEVLEFLLTLTTGPSQDTP